MREPRKILVNIEFTEGYQERFTTAVLKICSGRIRKEVNCDEQRRKIETN